jgi:multiple sugar transport system ATP-binding protein
MAVITVDGVSKVFDKGATAVDNVSLEVADGEFMVLVGPAGCGKSTLLRMIAGLESVTHGGVLIDGRDVTYAPSKDRDLAMVFQNYALYPHMTVRKNLGFGLKLRRMPKPDIDAKVTEVATMLGLDELLERKPGQLSGGQRQRVAMGRALVRQPVGFLMDEPLSNLDAKLRVTMRAELSRLHAEVGTTTIYVTHDQIEAMTLGQRVAILRNGTLQQVASPTELFHRPVNLFCAAFIGSPQMNLVEATISDGEARFAGMVIPLPVDSPLRSLDRAILGIRPSDLVAPVTAPEFPTISVGIDAVEDLGAHVHVAFGIDAPRVVTDVGSEDEEAEAYLLDGRTVWTAELPDRYRVAAGDRVELAVRNDRLHAFDVATGLRIGD